MARFFISAFADESDTSKTLHSQLKALSTNGLHWLELRNIEQKNICHLTNDELNEVRHMLSDHGVYISSIGSPFGKYPINEPFPLHKDAFLRGLEIAERLQVKRMRMFSFHIPKDEPASIYRDEVCRRIDDMLHAAAEAGVQLMHENEKEIYGDTADRCLDLLSTFEGRLLGVFDPANFIQCGVAPLQAMLLLKDHIAAMHIKDARMSTRRVVPCGMGDGSVADCIRILSRRADGLFLVVEPHLHTRNPELDPKEELLKYEYVYPDKQTTFCTAVQALLNTLAQLGFQPEKGDKSVWIL